MKIWHLKTRLEIQKTPQTEFKIQRCLATLSPSNGVTLVPDVRVWGEQTSAPSVQAAHQLCKGYLIFANTHMPFIKVTCSTIIWASDWLTLYVYNVNDGLSQSREISEIALHSTRMISAKILNYTTKDTTPGKIHHHTRKSPQQILYDTRCNIHSGLNQGTMHWYILLVLVKTLDWHFWISTARCTLGHLEFQSPHRWMICWIRRSWD